MWSIPNTYWSSQVVKITPTILAPITVVIILISVITLYCKCWQNRYSCVPKYTRPQHPPTSSNYITLATFPVTVHSQSHQVMPQVIQEILKSCDMDVEKFEGYKSCKANHQTTKV